MVMAAFCAGMMTETRGSLTAVAEPLEFVVAVDCEMEVFTPAPPISIGRSTGSL
jgi:hypothetical protein